MADTPSGTATAAAWPSPCGECGTPLHDSAHAAVHATVHAETGPVLLHAGTYALYRAPGGGLHITFTRTVGTDPSGLQRAIDGAPAEHLPDIPAEAVPLLESFLSNGFPPAVLALLSGKLNPMAIVKAMRAAGNGAELADADGSGPDGA